jgi:hypothetical protein
VSTGLPNPNSKFHLLRMSNSMLALVGPGAPCPPRRATSCHVMTCHATPCHVISRRATSCQAMPCGQKQCPPACPNPTRSSTLRLSNGMLALVGQIRTARHATSTALQIHNARHVIHSACNPSFTELDVI